MALFSPLCARVPSQVLASTRLLHQGPSRGLAIAFFGSDQFSVHSLSTVLDLAQQDPDLIDRVDVITRTPKRAGRTMKTSRPLPIVDYAQTKGLNLIRSDTNEQIVDLARHRYDLAIAVSYGVLIPRQFIEAVPYTLNVHPSLLPKYSGASPLQYALLNGDKFSGVTVQTLHPTKFDRGEIVAQTGEIPIDDNETLASLRDKLGLAGAQLLANVIKDGSYKAPSFQSKYPYSYAAKFTAADKHADFSLSAERLARLFKTLGPLYTFKQILNKKQKPQAPDWRRVILHDVQVSAHGPFGEPGDFMLSGDEVLVQTSHGVVKSSLLQFEYCPKEDAATFMKKLPKRVGDPSLPNKFTPKNI